MNAATQTPPANAARDPLPRIAKQDAIAIFCVLMITKLFLSSPIVYGSSSNNALYLSEVISTLLTLGMFFLMMWLLRRTGVGLLESYDRTLGKVVGFALKLVMGLRAFMHAVAYMRSLVEALSNEIFVHTPRELLLCYALLAVFIAVWKGMPILSRTVRIFLIPLAIGLGLILVLSTQSASLRYLFPLFGEGVGSVALAGFAGTRYSLDVLLLGVLLVDMQDEPTVRSTGLWSIVVCGVIQICALLLYWLVFPSYRDALSPMFQLVALFDLGHNLQRLQTVFVFVWGGALLVTISTYMWFAMHALCNAFHIPDERPVLLSGTLLLFFLASQTNRELPRWVTALIQSSMIDAALTWVPIPLALIASLLRGKSAGGANDGSEAASAAGGGGAGDAR